MHRRSSASSREIWKRISVNQLQAAVLSDPIPHSILFPLDHPLCGHAVTLHTCTALTMTTRPLTRPQSLLRVAVNHTVSAPTQTLASPPSHSSCQKLIQACRLAPLDPSHSALSTRCRMTGTKEKSQNSRTSRNPKSLPNMASQASSPRRPLNRPMNNMSNTSQTS